MWAQIAAYFDGDGSIDFDPRTYVVKINIRFVDNWKPQLESVRQFILRQGIIIGKVRWRKASRNQTANGARGVYVLTLSNRLGVVMVSSRMLPFSVKKRDELKIVIDYYGDKITGDEAIRRVNREVEIGQRSGKMKSSNIPYRHSEGVHMKDAVATARAREELIIHISAEKMREIRRDYYEIGVSLKKLSRQYGYGIQTLRRVLDRPR